MKVTLIMVQEGDGWESGQTAAFDFDDPPHDIAKVPEGVQVQTFAHLDGRAVTLDVVLPWAVLRDVARLAAVHDEPLRRYVSEAVPADA